MEKSCGCKGIRSCLHCESLNKKGDLHASSKEKQELIHVSFYTFLFDHASGYCTSQSEEIMQMFNANNGHINVENFLIGFHFPGVTIIPDFLSPTEECELVNKIDSCPWKNSQSGRCKQDYGPKVNFKKQKVKFATFSGLPFYIASVVKKMRTVSALEDFDVVEQCNLEYVPERGSQIEAHFDDEWLWGERLVTLNLLSDTWFTMTCASDNACPLKTFRREDLLINNISQFSSHICEEKLTYNMIKVKIPLNRRSLVILDGPARHKWKHAIERQDITSRRVCCTFRELSKLFKDSGEKSDVGKDLLTIASTFNGSVVL